jgi:hypothetical protein
MFGPYLQRVYQNLIKGGRKPRSRRVLRTSRPPTARLAVEGLEQRTLLSTLVLSGGSLIYQASSGAATNLSISDNSATHRYTFTDTAENIQLIGNFINPSGNLTHSVSFGDGNITSIAVNTSNLNDIVNIEQTLNFVPLTVNLGNGTDVVNVSPLAQNLSNILGAVTVHPGQGTDSLNVNDQANSGFQMFTMDAISVRRSGSATISYGQGSIANVTINGGSGNNTYNVSDIAHLYTTTLNTGNGHDTVNVDHSGSTSSAFVINDGTGGVDVNLGASSHNLDNLLGTVQVNGANQGVDNLVLNDTANSSAHTFTLYVVNPLSPTNMITRTGALTGHFNYNALIDHVTLGGGIGANTFNVQATGAATDIIGHANATVNVGSGGRLGLINKDLTITDPPAYVTLNVDDSAETSFRTATLQTVTIGRFSFGDIGGLSVGDIKYKYGDTNSVIVQTGPGGARVNALTTGKPVNLIGNPSGAISLYASDAGGVPLVLLACRALLYHPGL